MVRRMENARKNTTYPAAGSFGRTKAKGGRGFYLWDKKNFLGSLRRADYVAKPSTDMSNSAERRVSHVSNDVQVGNNTRPQRNISQAGGAPKPPIPLSKYDETEEVNDVMFGASLHNVRVWMCGRKVVGKVYYRRHSKQVQQP